MTELGKKIRAKRIFSGRYNTALIVPMDHGAEGYFERLEDPRQIIESVINSGANAFLFRRGLAKFASSQYAGRAGFILRITCASILRKKVTEQVFVSTVEEALRLGADAVAATVFVGERTEREDLRYFGLVADACDKWGMPLMGEVFPVGGPESEPFDGPYAMEDVRVAVRICAEEGADFIKTYYTGSAENFKNVVRYSTVPIVMSGGPAKTSGEVLEMVKGVMDAGAAGISMGRNIWGYENPALMTKALAKIVHEKANVSEALEVLKRHPKS